MCSDSKEIDHATIVRWVEEIHATTATLNLKPWFDNFLTEDITIQFFTAPLLQGVPQIEPVFKAVQSQLSGLKHDMIHTDYVAPRIYHRCIVHYLFPPVDGAGDEEEIKADVLVIWHVREEEVFAEGQQRLRCYRMEVFGDGSGLFGRVKLG